jgi:hypothetical protein
MPKTRFVQSSLLVSALAFALSACGAADEPLSEEEVATAQSALTSCTGAGCNGLDPSTTPCASGATTVATKPIYRNNTNIQIGYVELRWSSTCGTNWARVTRTDGAYAEGMYATVTRADGLSYTDFHTGYTTIWSRMVYAPNACAKARGLIDESWTSGSGETSWVC